MDFVIDESKCTGCTACMNICPKKAILMDTNKEGFKYPVVNNKKCINCGLCKKICPVLKENYLDALNKCYVGFNKEISELINSSSGAIFPIIANYILEENGVIIGATFNEKKQLKHIAVTNKENLYKLKGSKYLQSDLNDIFMYIKYNIEKNKILFVGTPCQVAGLKAFLKNDYHNLLCIDFICHGVPSPKLFEKYIKELEHKYNDKIINYNFRDKKTGWSNYSNTAIFKKRKISQIYKENEYMRLFLSDIALRKSCYNCKFKLGNKHSDITLGDFWGVKKYHPEIYNEKGVSAIILNTKRGEGIFEKIKNNLIYKECELNEIIDGNPSLINSSKDNKMRDEFFLEMKEKTIQELSKQYLPKTNSIKKGITKIKNKIKTKCRLI
ncbi:MAG: Coenzyme F420 hydrogenase/dehydrogenase, beta subunit C-terminal domain [Clostridia bacterium]|nr:Coenzyme F420 hydrogenase/dehydrogenase, beta subunit C-terminal domain [Clostridia bacterium]